jgi:hypothetical protein
MRRLTLIASFLIALGLSPLAANAAVANPRVERVDKDHVVVSWEDSAPVSIYVSDQANATIAQSRLLTEGNSDGRYMAATASAQAICAERPNGSCRSSTVQIFATSEGMQPPMAGTCVGA